MTRVAVVTGGGGGIGKAAAISLSKDGWNVVVAGRTQSSLDETVAAFDKQGLAVVCDVADEKAVDALFNNCLLYTSPSPRDKRQSRMPSSA